MHCTEGKDRAGFVSALLECYMGAAYDEVVADYMITYYNYYGVTKEAEPAKYDAILRSNIVKTLQTAFGVNDLKTADLKQEATDFFKELGLTDAELTNLTANLSKKYTGGSTSSTVRMFPTVISLLRSPTARSLPAPSWTLLLSRSRRPRTATRSRSTASIFTEPTVRIR